MEVRQLLRNPSIEPTRNVIAECLGSANDAYLKFIDGLKNHDVQVEWRYYNDGKAWLGKALYKWTTTRNMQKEVTAFWLSIWDEAFKVSLYIPEKARSDALSLAIGDKIRERERERE